MGEGTRRRLPHHERRAQLIEIGRRHVEQASFDAISTDEIAADAGISRGLLFHYFPTRDDFLRALAEDASEELLQVTDPPSDLAPVARLRAGLAAYIDFVAERPAMFLSLIRGAAGGNAEMQEIFERTRGALAGRILEGLGVAARDPAVRHMARGYIALVEEVTVSWLRDGASDPQRDELIEALEAAAVVLLQLAGVAVDELLVE